MDILKKLAGVTPQTKKHVASAWTPEKWTYVDGEKGRAWVEKTQYGSNSCTHGKACEKHGYIVGLNADGVALRREAKKLPCGCIVATTRTYRAGTKTVMDTRVGENYVIDVIDGEKTCICRGNYDLCDPGYSTMELVIDCGYHDIYDLEAEGYIKENEDENEDEDEERCPDCGEYYVYSNRDDQNVCQSCDEYVFISSLDDYISVYDIETHEGLREGYCLIFGDIEEY